MPHFITLTFIFCKYLREKVSGGHKYLAFATFLRYEMYIQMCLTGCTYTGATYELPPWEFKHYCVTMTALPGGRLKTICLYYGCYSTVQYKYNPRLGLRWARLYTFNTPTQESKISTAHLLLNGFSIKDFHNTILANSN